MTQSVDIFVKSPNRYTIERMINLQQNRKRPIVPQNLFEVEIH